MRLFTLAAVMLFAVGAFAQGPYLTCDPYPTTVAQPDDFVIVLNGATYYSAAVENPDGSRYLLFDLNGLYNPGPNDTLVWARNVWGESAQVPFAFTAEPPAAPTGNRIVGSPP